MGVVYQAFDDMIDRRVAIKSLRMDKFKTDEERNRVRHLFFKEAKIIGKLNHSHITAIYDMGEQDGNPYLVMEYINGYTIKDLIPKAGKYSLEERLRLVAMVARALHYAHQRGIIHRDIKPANIMVLENNTPKIMDFGIAGAMESAGRTISEELDEENGVILGTPSYMSPEQIRSKELDQRSDLFSLGILAYEWLCGHRPFTGNNLKELLTSILKHKPTPLSSLCDIGEELCDVVNKALAKNPSDRYKSADAFSDAIELALSNIEKRDKSAVEAKDFSYNKRKIIDQLQKNYVFFSDFSREELYSIFRMSGHERFKTGETIIQEGTSGSKMYIIIVGKVAIMKESEGRKMEINRLESGDCFGEMAIVDRMPRSASAVALEPTTVIAINEVVLRTSDPQLCMKLYRSLASMISEKLRISDSKYFEIAAQVKKRESSV